MKNAILPILLIFLAIAFSNSCKKNPNEEGTPGISTNTGGSGSMITATLSGMVLDESNNAVIGATVTAYGKTITTNLQGIFFFDKISVNDKRCIVQFSKAGFFNRSHAIIPAANNVNYMKIVLMDKPAMQTFTSSAGGTLTATGGASVLFAANSVSKADGSPYTGTVNITMKPLPTDAANFGLMIPGGDLAGKDTNNNDVILTSFGMIGVELTGSGGEALNLSSGTTATLTMPIASAQLSSAPASIPLWYFDEATSLWKEQGVANKVGSNYVGTVGHFSWWNCDHADARALIKGRVIDSDGNTIPNIIITVNKGYIVITDQLGEYSKLCPINNPLNFEVMVGNNNLALQSQIENVSPLSAGQIFNVPDLVCPTKARITGSFKGCSNEIVNGIASITNSNNVIINYQYAINGLFNLITPPNILLGFTGISDIGTAHTIVSSPNSDSSLSIGTIQLCNTFQVPENSFHLISNGIDTIIGIDSTYSSANWSTGWIRIQILGPHDIGVHLNHINNVPGIYLLNTAQYNLDYSVATMFVGSVNHKTSDPGNQFYLTIENLDSIGNVPNVKGSFYGVFGQYEIKAGRFNLLKIR